MPPTPRATIARADAPDRPSQRPDEPSTTSDSRQPRDAASSSKTAAKAPSQDDEPNAVQPVAAGSNADAGAVSKPVKPGSAKTGIVKAAVKDAASDIVTATDSTTSADPAAPAQAAAVTSATPAAVAAVIAVPVAATDIVAAPASPAGTTEPLAIAAAAIATSTSTVEASKPVTAAVQGVGRSAKAHLGTGDTSNHAIRSDAGSRDAGRSDHGCRRTGCGCSRQRTGVCN